MYLHKQVSICIRIYMHMYVRAYALPTALLAAELERASDLVREQATGVFRNSSKIHPCRRIFIPLCIYSHNTASSTSCIRVMLLRIFGRLLISLIMHLDENCVFVCSDSFPTLLFPTHAKKHSFYLTHIYQWFVHFLHHIPIYLPTYTAVPWI